MKEKHRLLAILLSLAMVLSYMPALAFAGTEEESPADTPAVEESQDPADTSENNDADAGKGVTVKSVEGLSEESEENDEYGDDDEEEGESEIASIEFRTKIGSCTQEKPRILYDGEDNYYDDEDDCIRYNLRFMKGDELIVNYTDPEKEASHYFYYRYGDFYDSEHDLYTDEVYLSSNQYDQPWEPGNTYEAYVKFEGFSYPVYYKVKESRIGSIEYSNADGLGKTADKPIELVEGKDGSLEKDSDGKEFFEYYYNGKSGDLLTVNYKDPDKAPVTYTRDGRNYYDASGKKLKGDTDFNLGDQWDEHWTPGNTYSATIQHGSTECTVYFKVIANPIKSVEFATADGFGSSAKPIELRDGIDGDEFEEGFIYDYDFKSGDELTINYNDGSVKTYHYNANKYRFIDEEGYKLSGWPEFDVERPQYDELWEIGKTYSADLEYRAKKVAVYFKTVENPIKSIEYSNAEGCGASADKPIELIEGYDGYMDYEDYEDESSEYFRYSANLKEGDVLTVHYKDSSKAPEKYYFNYNKWEFFRADGEEPEFDTRLSTDEDGWTTGNIYQGLVKAAGLSTDVFFRTVPNPVQAVAFSREGGIKFREGVDGVRRSSYFRYDLNYLEGDLLTVTYKDGGAPVQYVAVKDSASDEFASKFVKLENGKQNPDVFIPVSAVESESDEQYGYCEWKYNDGAEHYYKVSYLGVETEQMPVQMLENPVSSFDFSRTGGVELMDQVDGINSDGGNGKFFQYMLKFKQGDVIEVSRPDGSKDRYEAVAENGAVSRFVKKTSGGYDETDFIPVEKIAYKSDPSQGKTHWTLADDFDHSFILTYTDKTYTVPVKLLSDTHTCVGGDPVRENETASTCSKEGSYEEVVYCTKCGKELSRTKKTVAKLAHTWGQAEYKWNADYTEVTGTHKCTVCGEAASAKAKRASAKVTKSPTLTEKGTIEYKSEGFAEEGFEAQTVTVETELSAEEKAVEQAVADADAQTNDASGKADAAENSADENVVSSAEDSAAKAAELAAKAEAAAQQAFDKAEAAFVKALDSGDAAQVEIAKSNLDVATNNLTTAKVIKAAASSSLAKAKKAAAKVASSKAAAASEAAKNAADPVAAEELRKEAETQAAIAAEKAASAETASAEASKAAADLGELADKIADPAVKEAVKKEQAAAEKSAEAASESAKAAETSTEEAKASEAAAEEAVSEKTRQGVYDSKIPKMTIKSKTSKKTSITIKWKWTSSGKKKLKKSKATKYEIWVCPNKKFAKEDTVVKTCSKSKSSYTVKSLKKNKKYYFKVRAIKYVNGVKHVGKWSSLKYIKTKKK